jgi:signal transduction histidine kinase
MILDFRNCIFDNMNIKNIFVFSIALFYFIIINDSIAYSQGLSIPELKGKIEKTKSDSVKCVLYNELAIKYFRRNPDSALFYSNIVKDLQQYSKNYLILGNAHKNIAIINSIKKNYSEAENNFKKSYRYYQLHGVDQEHYATNYYTNMAIVNSQRRDYQTSILYGDSVKSILNQKTDSLSKAKLAKVYQNESNLYNDIGSYKRAIESNLTALRIYESLGSVDGLGSIYLNIGNSFGHLEEFDKALEYYEIAKRISEKEFNMYIYTKSIHNIASMLFSKNEIDTSVKLLIDLILILDSLNLEKEKNSSFITLANCYVMKGDFKSANVYFNKSLEIAQKYDDPQMKLSSYTNYASFLIDNNEFTDALRFNDDALTFAIKFNHKDKLIDIYKNYADAYQGLNRYDSSLVFFIKHYELKDSVSAIKLKNEIYNLETQYQTAQKEKENQQLQFENELQKQENAKIRSQNLLIISSSVFAAVLLLVSFIVYRNTQKNKFNKLVLKEIDEQNDMIAKNLHDGMSGYLYAVKNKLEYRQRASEDFNQEIEIIDRSQKELRFLMRQLSSPYYKNKNFDLSNELSELNHFYENSSDFKIDSYFDQSIIWKNISYENKLQIYKLAQELLANVKKHSGASNISLQIIKDKKNLVLSMEDDGKGFDIKESVAGYGLKNMEKRIKDLKGNLNIDSKPGKGTFISFTIPVLT